MSTECHAKGMTAVESCHWWFSDTTSSLLVPMSWVVTPLPGGLLQSVDRNMQWSQKVSGQWSCLNQKMMGVDVALQAGSEMTHKIVSAFRVPLLLVFFLKEHCFLDTYKHQLMTKVMTPGFSLNAAYNCMQSASYGFAGFFFFCMSAPKGIRLTWSWEYNRRTR